MIIIHGFQLGCSSSPRSVSVICMLKLQWKFQSIIVLFSQNYGKSETYFSFLFFKWTTQIVNNNTIERCKQLLPERCKCLLHWSLSFHNLSYSIKNSKKENKSLWINAAFHNIAFFLNFWSNNFYLFYACALLWNFHDFHKFREDSIMTKFANLSARETNYQMIYFSFTSQPKNSTYSNLYFKYSCI